MESLISENSRMDGTLGATLGDGSVAADTHSGASKVRLQRAGAGRCAVCSLGSWLRLDGGQWRVEEEQKKRVGF